MRIETQILPDNPAARLQSMLDRMLAMEFSDRETISPVFARALDIRDHPTEILPHYSQLFILIDEAYEKVMEFYPKQQRTHAGWRGHLTSAFQKHSPYHHEWKVLITAIKQGMHLDMIQIANDNLEHFVQPTKVHGLTLDELEQQVKELIEEINESSELSAYLKAFLQEELEKILVSIKHFDLYGSEPIRKSIYSIVANSEVSKNFTAKAITGVITLLSSVACAIGVVNDVSSFPDSLKDLRDTYELPYIEEIESMEVPQFLINKDNPQVEESPEVIENTTETVLEK